MALDEAKLTSNIMSDCALFIEWTESNGLLNMISAANPLARINGMTATQSVHRAIGYLVQGGTALRDVWSLEDLIKPAAFKIITQNALARSRPEAQCMAFVLLIIAKEWIAVEAAHLESLEDIAKNLPTTAFSRSFKFQRARTGQMYPLNLRQNVRLKTSA